jgi:hypothetical protein
MESLRIFTVKMWQQFKKETKDIYMSVDCEQLEYNMWLINKLHKLTYKNEDLK